MVLSDIVCVKNRTYVFFLGMKIVVEYRTINLNMNFLYGSQLKVIISIALCLFTCTDLLSQSKKDRAAFKKDSLAIMKPKLVRPQFRIDNRNIFYKNQNLTVNGLDAGVLLKEKLRLTLGYYTLNNVLSAYKKTVDEVELNRKVKLDYGTINTEFIYKNTRFFSLGMPLEFGFGNNILEYYSEDGTVVQEKSSGFLCITDFGLSVTFKPIRWVGLKGLLGYRKTVFNQVKDFEFDGVFTSLGLNIDLREISRDVKMFKLIKKYKKRDQVETAVDLITD